MLHDIGVELSIITAGFIGGLVSLSMTRDLTPFRALATVVAGAASAGYLTPIAMIYAGFGQGAEHALAFLLGVCGMNAIAGIFRISERFASNPLETLKGVAKNGKGNGKE